MTTIPNLINGTLVPTTPPAAAYPPCAGCGRRHVGLTFPSPLREEGFCRECRPDLFAHDSPPTRGTDVGTVDYSGTILAGLLK